VRSLPARLGADRAARLACIVMAGAQVAVAAMLAFWGFPFHAAIVAALVVAQAGLMAWLLRDPQGRAARYNATGTTLYVLGMLVSALALRAAGGT
jgi:chlorophyll synthase